MKNQYLTLALGLILSAGARADGVLQMTGPDSAVAHYDDQCSNGANIVEATRTEFINKMLANPKSKLGKLKAQLTIIEDEFQMAEGALTQWIQTYHLRSGCGTNENSFTAILQSHDTISNSNTVESKYLVTVDDDDESGVRTLRLRSIQRLNIR